MSARPKNRKKTSKNVECMRKKRGRAIPMSTRMGTRVARLVTPVGVTFKWQSSIYSRSSFSFAGLGLTLSIFSA